MPEKILTFQKKDKQGKLRNVGKMEIRNQTEDTAELYFYGDICSEAWQSEWYKDDQAPSDIQEFLKDLDGVNTVHVHINSGGGSVTGGIAIGNMLKAHPATMIAYIDAMAASIATVIALSCDRVVIYKNSIFMIHKPSVSWFSGNADDLRKEADVLDTCQKSILTTYMAKVKDGVTEEKVNELIDAETWFTGEEAAEIFDIEVDALENNAAAAASDYYNKYRNTPKNLKESKVSISAFINSIKGDTAAEKEFKAFLKDYVTEILEDKGESVTDPPDDEAAKREKLKNEILKDLDCF